MIGYVEEGDGGDFVLESISPEPSSLRFPLGEGGNRHKNQTGGDGRKLYRLKVKPTITNSKTIELLTSIKRIDEIVFTGLLDKNDDITLQEIKPEDIRTNVNYTSFVETASGSSGGSEVSTQYKIALHTARNKPIMNKILKYIDKTIKTSEAPPPSAPLSAAQESGSREDCEYLYGKLYELFVEKSSMIFTTIHNSIRKKCKKNEEVKKMNAAGIKEWLKDNEVLDEDCELFLKNNIDGKKLVTMDAHDISTLGVKEISRAIKIASLISQLKDDFTRLRNVKIKQPADILKELGWIDNVTVNNVFIRHLNTLCRKIKDIVNMTKGHRNPYFYRLNLLLIFAINKSIRHSANGHHYSFMYDILLRIYNVFIGVFEGLSSGFHIKIFYINIFLESQPLPTSQTGSRGIPNVVNPIPGTYNAIVNQEISKLVNGDIWKQFESSLDIMLRVSLAPVGQTLNSKSRPGSPRSDSASRPGSPRSGSASRPSSALGTGSARTGSARTGSPRTVSESRPSSALGPGSALRPVLERDSSRRYGKSVTLPSLTPISVKSTNGIRSSQGGSHTRKKPRMKSKLINTRRRFTKEKLRKTIKRNRRHNISSSNRTEIKKTRPASAPSASLPSKTSNDNTLQ